MAKKTIKFPAKIINHYINSLQKKINLQGVLLFGSFAWGKPTTDSDVDLIIISPDFNKKQFANRLQWLSRMRDDYSSQTAMDIVGYTPEEFIHAENSSTIMARAKKEGKWLFRK
jgi:predicted nucleotidyltransferase